MAVLIDETNYASYLKQSTQSRAGTPDGNVYFDVANNLIELIGVDELATFNHTSMGGGANDPNQLANFEGITLRALYNFENQERVADENLRKYLRGSRGTYRFAGAFDFINGVKLAASDRNKIRGSGWIEFADTQDGATDIDRIYHGVGSLVDIQAGTQPQYALVANTLEATLQAATWNNFNRLGDINEAVQVYGSTAFGDTGAGTQDDRTNTLVVRVRSWGYNPGETTSVLTGIAEFSGFFAGYGVGESINPANTYNLADVYGGAQIAPWTGMTLERLAVPQVETGFNETDGNFRWVLHNTLGGTVQECAAYLDALTLQASDIDVGAGVYDGSKGRVWYTRNAAGLVVTNSFEGEGLFIEGLSTAEKQNVINTDDAGATKTYPFFPDVQITVGAAAVADVNAFYHVFYVDGAAAADFDTAGAVTVRDDTPADVKGNVSTDAVANKISFAYRYDTDTDAGLPAATDKDCVVIVEGDGGVAQAITYFTITRDPVVPVTCVPPTDDNA
jgi:hypothetical protein